jgi:hypothetical protein
MSEHKVQGGDMLLFIDPNGGTDYNTVVCLTSVGVSDSVNVVDASSACGPDKSIGALEISYSFEGQHLQDPETGSISGTDLRALLRAEQTIGWKMSPLSPIDGDEIHSGTGWLSELSSTYSYDSIGTFTGVLQPYNEPTIEISGGSGAFTFTQFVTAYTAEAGILISPTQIGECTGGVPPYSFSVYPALPSGVTFNTSTCYIGGTPISTSALAGYTISAFDSSTGNQYGNLDFEVV